MYWNFLLNLPKVLLPFLSFMLVVKNKNEFSAVKFIYFIHFEVFKSEEFLKT